MGHNLTAEEMAKYIDVNDGLSRVRGNQSLYKRMLNLYVGSTEFQAFEDAMAQQDYHKAGEVAHAIKGMAGNLGLKRVFELSNDIMTQFRQDVISQELVAEFRSAVSITLDGVKELMETMG